MFRTLLTLAVTSLLVVCTTCLPKSGAQQGDPETYVANAPHVERRHGIRKRATNEEDSKDFMREDDGIGNEDWAQQQIIQSDKRGKFGFHGAGISELSSSDLDRALDKLNRFKAHLLRRKYALARAKGDYSRVRKFLNSENIGDGFQNLGSKPLRQQRRRQGPEFNPTGW